MGTPLHMDVSAATEASNRIGNDISSAADLWNALSQRMQQLVSGEWQAPAADQFSQDFQTWYQAELRQLEALNELMGRLEREIAQWTETGGRLE